MPQTVRPVDRVTYTQFDRDRNDFTRKTIHFFQTIYWDDWHFAKLTVLQTWVQSNVGMTTVMIPVTKLRQQLLRTSNVITALRVASVMSLPVTWCKRLLLHNDHFTAILLVLINSLAHIVCLQELCHCTRYSKDTISLRTLIMLKDNKDKVRLIVRTLKDNMDTNNIKDMRGPLRILRTTNMLRTTILRTIRTLNTARTLRTTRTLRKLRTMRLLQMLRIWLTLITLKEQMLQIRTWWTSDTKKSYVLNNHKHNKYKIWPDLTIPTLAA